MWIHRKEHFRNAGRTPERSKVAATVYFLPDTREPPPRPSDARSGGHRLNERHRDLIERAWEEVCPLCGAAIRVSKPAHGGTAVSEILPSGALIPHPCFDRLRGKRPSDETLDLFEWNPK